MSPTSSGEPEAMARARQGTRNARSEGKGGGRRLLTEATRNKEVEHRDVTENRKSVKHVEIHDNDLRGCTLDKRNEHKRAGDKIDNEEAHFATQSDMGNAARWSKSPHDGRRKHR